MRHRISQLSPPMFAAALCAVMSVSMMAAPAVAASSNYHILNTFTLGGEGGWDYLNRDPVTGNLFITRGTHVMVVDPKSGKIVGDVPDLKAIHGTAFAGGRAYISEGGANQVTVVDSKSLAKISTIAVGTRPDGILYDPATKRIFTFNAGSSDATAIDTASGQVVSTVALGGKPEAAASDGAGTIFVNIENKSELAMFDAKALTVKGSYPLAPCQSPSGMAMDVAHARVFSVCDGGVMTVADAKTGKIVTTVKIGDGPDASRFDPAAGLIFSSNGDSGTLTVVHEDTPDKYSVADEIPTAAGARTMELDPTSHMVFLVTQDRKITPPTADQPRPRATAVPGTFRLIVLGR